MNFFFYVELLEISMSVKLNRNLYKAWGKALYVLGIYKYWYIFCHTDQEIGFKDLKLNNYKCT